MSMDSTQVNELTTGQKSLLSPGQTAALKGVQQDDPKDPDPWTCSGNYYTQFLVRQTKAVPLNIKIARQYEDSVRQDTWK